MEVVWATSKPDCKNTLPDAPVLSSPATMTLEAREVSGLPSLHCDESALIEGLFVLAEHSWDYPDKFRHCGIPQVLSTATLPQPPSPQIRHYLQKDEDFKPFI